MPSAVHAVLRCLSDVIHLTALACNRPYFTIRNDETVVGAVTSFTRSTEQECLDYCVLTPECEGVDVDYNEDPVMCWPHTNVNDYVDSNIYYQPGTNSYQLLTRCASTGCCFLALFFRQ